jgi:hypothetical protein
MPVTFVELDGKTGARIRIASSVTPAPTRDCSPAAETPSKEYDARCALNAAIIRSLRRSVEALKREDPQMAFEEAAFAYVMADGTDPKLFEVAGTLMGRASTALAGNPSGVAADS